MVQIGSSASPLPAFPVGRLLLPPSLVARSSSSVSLIDASKEMNQSIKKEEDGGDAQKIIASSSSQAAHQKIITKVKTESAVTVVTKLEGKCDICEKRDGFQGFNLQVCRVCGVAVHERCYGMSSSTTKNSNFVCKACNSVGSQVEVNRPSVLGRTSRTKETIRIDERPTGCVLCDVQDGIHALHPLFDTHGKEARQLAISTEGGGKKLAWVHTLCANFICTQTGGSVYACYGNDGRYEDDSDEEYSDEEDRDIRFYSMATEETGEEWAKIISERRKSILCSVCGKKDNDGDSMRIAVQCCANDENELIDFKKRHIDRSQCYVGMHVGCSRWKVNPPIVYGRSCAMCYFFDGVDADEDNYAVPVANSYCRLHAEEIILNNPKHRAKYNRKEQEKTRKIPNIPTVARTRPRINKKMVMNNEHRASFKAQRDARKRKSVEKERKRGAGDESPLKRQSVKVIYPVKGKASRAMSDPKLKTDH